MDRAKSAHRALRHAWNSVDEVELTARVHGSENGASECRSQVAPSAHKEGPAMIGGPARQGVVCVGANWTARVISSSGPKWVIRAQ